MPVIPEIIRLENDGGLSFGNYKVTEKQKVNEFAFHGDLYNVKTHNLVTRIEKNAKMLFESVPGSAVHHMKLSDKLITFSITGMEDTQITMELEANQEYKILIDDVNVGNASSKASGKINFSIELNDNLQNVQIEKI